MISKTWNHAKTLYDTFSFPRWWIVHAVLGAMNFAIAYVLFYELGSHHQVATAVGHFFHVLVGYFADRHISYRAALVPHRDGFWKYWMVEACSYSSIYLTMYLMVDVFGYPEWLSRAGAASIIGTAVSYGLNHVWTFKKSS